MNQEYGHQYADHDDLVLRIVLNVVKRGSLEPPYDNHERVRRETVRVEEERTRFALPLVDHEVEEEAKEEQLEAAGVFFATVAGAGPSSLRHFLILLLKNNYLYLF